MTYREIEKILRIVVITLFFILILTLFVPYVNIALCILLVLILLYLYFIGHIKETTLCLIVKDDKVLMMLRNKKKNDVHLNKYNGLGGKLEKNESKVQCVLREVNEEAGIILTDYHYVGKVTFKNFGYQKGIEIMYCFVGHDFENEIGYCNEGELEWIDKEKVMDLPLWDGDQYFLMDIIENKPFKAFLHYENESVIGMEKW